MTRRARITVADASRVIKAAVRAGERAVIEIDPNGTIRIIPNDDRVKRPKATKEIASL